MKIKIKYLGKRYTASSLEAHKRKNIVVYSLFVIKYVKLPFKRSIASSAVKNTTFVRD